MDIDIPDMRHILGKASRKPTLGEFLSTPVSVGYGRARVIRCILAHCLFWG
jgi:hypothetical protein